VKRVVLIALLAAAFPAADARADALVPSSPSAVDTKVLTSHDVQGNPQTDPLLTCRYGPPPSSSGGPEYAIEISWVTPKASPDTHPYYGCGQKASSPAVVVSQDHEAYARVNTTSAPPDYLAEAAKLLKTVEASYARPCGNAPADRDEVEVKDTKPPRVQAITSYGQRAAGIRLAFRVTDDSGEARMSYGVYTPDGKRLLARGSGGFVKVIWGARRWFTFKPPRGMFGTYQFCVVATDRVGNRSKPSCATLDIRK
jgi:hypothetical protein